MNPGNFMFDTKLALELWKDGLNDRRIGEAVNAYPYQIQNWRKKNGLKANTSGGRKPGHITGYHQTGKSKGKKEKRVEHLCDKTCYDCKHFGTHVGSCDYILHTKKRRPCPAGKGCTVKEEIPVRHRARYRLDHEEAMRYYNEGRNDVNIAMLLKVSPAAVRWWRLQNGLKSHIVYKKGWDKQKAREYHAQGWSDRQIADALDIAPSVIWNWRAREGLPRNEKK